MVTTEWRAAGTFQELRKPGWAILGGARLQHVRNNTSRRLSVEVRVFVAWTGDSVGQAGSERASEQRKLHCDGRGRMGSSSNADRHFDALILGCGSAGTTAAKRLRADGHTVAVVERDQPGGDCPLR